MLTPFQYGPPSNVIAVSPTPSQSMDEASLATSVHSHPPGHKCDVPGCKSGLFKRRGDLTRHKHSHSPQQLRDCLVPNCDRSGTKGFVRKDKLTDHMLAGHDEDTLFPCPMCGLYFTRDLISMHLDRSYSGAYYTLASYRTCPMPRCSFKVNSEYDHNFKRMSKLQQHLIDKHDPKARNTFIGLLKSRGYDARSAQLFCPVCPFASGYTKTDDFVEHLMQAHFHGPACAHHGGGSCLTGCYVQRVRHRLPVWISIPDEVLQHRRTILRIWPGFQYYPIWADIKCPGKTG
jgi:hypothetical protein